jgi:hypothetical protein
MTITHGDNRMGMTFYSWGSRLLFLLSLLFLTTACQVATAQFSDPIKVGLLLPLEGEQRELGNSLLPALFAATPATIQGHPVEWVILDTHGDPATAAQRARELVADPAVLYVLGPLLYDEVDAVESIFAEAGMAWTPLVPTHADGIARQTWEPQCWVDQRLTTPDEEQGTITLCVRVTLPDDTTAYESSVGSQPSSLSWLVWDTTTFMMNQLNQVPTLDRPTIYQAAEPYGFPPLESYEY